MTHFDKEYYETLTEEQKRHYIDDCNLQFTMNRVYGGLGRGNTDCLFVIDDLPFYRPPYTHRIHPKRNRQRSKAISRISRNKTNRQIKNLRLTIRKNTIINEKMYSKAPAHMQVASTIDGPTATVIYP